MKMGGGGVMKIVVGGREGEVTKMVEVEEVR